MAAHPKAAVQTMRRKVGCEVVGRIKFPVAAVTAGAGLLPRPAGSQVWAPPADCSHD